MEAMHLWLESLSTILILLDLGILDGGKVNQSGLQQKEPEVSLVASTSPRCFLPDLLLTLSFSLTVPSSIIAWPGPPVTSGGDRPSFFQKYEPQWKLKDRYNQISDWLDLEIEKRPQLICTYVPDVDQLGHKSGSNSVDDALSRVDLFIASLSDLIGSRNLSQIMDLIIVSDRGMTDTSTSRLVYLDKVLGSELFSQIQSQDIWPNVGLHFEGGAELGKKRLETAERILREASKSHGSGGGKAFKVYRKEEIPESWGWKKSSRLAELLLIPETGWSFTNEEEMRIHSIDGVYQPLGSVFLLVSLSFLISWTQS